MNKFINQNIISVLIGVIASYFIVSIVESNILSMVCFLLSLVCLMFALQKFIRLEDIVNRSNQITFMDTLKSIITNYHVKSENQGDTPRDKIRKTILDIQNEKIDKLKKQELVKKTRCQGWVLFWTAILFMILGLLIVAYKPNLNEYNCNSSIFKNKETIKDDSLTKKTERSLFYIIEENDTTILHKNNGTEEDTNNKK